MRVNLCMLVFGSMVRAVNKGELIGRVRRECGEWALEAVVRECGSARGERVVLEGLVRAEDRLEGDGAQGPARVASRAALRAIRRELEVLVYP